jgi:hypothetical protein
LTTTEKLSFFQLFILFYTVPVEAEVPVAVYAPAAQEGVVEGPGLPPQTSLHREQD